MSLAQEFVDFFGKYKGIANTIADMTPNQIDNMSMAVGGAVASVCKTKLAGKLDSKMICELIIAGAEAIEKKADEE